MRTQVGGPRARMSFYLPVSTQPCPVLHAPNASDPDEVSPEEQPTRTMRKTGNSKPCDWFGDRKRKLPRIEDTPEVELSGTIA